MGPEQACGRGQETYNTLSSKLQTIAIYCIMHADYLLYVCMSPICYQMFDARQVLQFQQRWLLHSLHFSVFTFSYSYMYRLLNCSTFKQRNKMIKLLHLSFITCINVSYEPVYPKQVVFKCTRLAVGKYQWNFFSFTNDCSWKPWFGVPQEVCCTYSPLWKCRRRPGLIVFMVILACLHKFAGRPRCEKGADLSHYRFINYLRC